MSAVNKISMIVILSFILTLSFACSSSEDENNCNCGQGYECKQGECVKIQIEDGDDEIDLEPEYDEELEPELEPEYDEELEPEIEEEVEEEQDQEDFQCTGDQLDPKCNGFFSQNFCRDNTVEHPVWECDSDNLGEIKKYCNLVFDCNYPNCGWVINYISPTECSEGCVSNPDPQKDDYCKEDGPPVDGDEEDGDVEIDGDDEMEEELEIVYPNGHLCSKNDDCISGACRLDIDASAKYCSDDRDNCVYHVDIAEGDPAIFYTNGDRICMDATQFKRCSSGNWMEPTICKDEYCEVGQGIWHFAETCDPGIQNIDAYCRPGDPEDEPCPENLLCLNDDYCRNSCSENSHCRAGYSCDNGSCTKD